MKKIIEPKISPGFIELLPEDQIIFNKMINTISKTYEQFGFSPIDTPVLEISEVLLAKAGGETEKQVYSLKKGDTDLTMRFDLTVPLARYIAKNQNLINFPFKRYQIGKVWRGEKPQKGRFREFYQCDIDIVGDGELSIINDAEIPAVIYNTFKNLGFENFTIKINNRKILTGLFEYLNVSDKSLEILRIIDKLEKIGIEKIREEFLLIELNDENINFIINFITVSGNSVEICQKLSELKIENEKFIKGLEELLLVSKYISNFGIPNANFKIDLTIARGLDYYTGTVYETILNDYPQIGSVCSGGRYDDLAGFFTEKKLPGVGISIGLSRLFCQLKENNFIKSNIQTTMQALIIPMGENLSYALEVATELRNNGLKIGVYLENKKFNKKLNYANKLQVPYIIIIGENEINERKITLKCMKTGEQESIDFENISLKLLNKF